MRRPGPSILIAGLLGGAATASGIALTATSGWLIVRAAERPVILTLLMAIVAVRAFGIARPYFRYVERVRSHDTVLDDLATREFEFVLSRCRGDKNGFPDFVEKLFEPQWSVKMCGRQPKPIIHKCQLSCVVAVVHSSHLRQSHVRFIH